MTVGTTGCSPKVVGVGFVALAVDLNRDDCLRLGAGA